MLNLQTYKPPLRKGNSKSSVMFTEKKPQVETAGKFDSQQQRVKDFKAINLLKQLFNLRKNWSRLRTRSDIIPFSSNTVDIGFEEFLSAVRNVSELTKSPEYSNNTASAGTNYGKTVVVHSETPSFFVSNLDLSLSESDFDRPYRFQNLCKDDFSGLRCLGRGGMGAVYTAKMNNPACAAPDLEFHGEYAIKKIRKINDYMETVALELVSCHKNIVTYYGDYEDGPFKYLVMERLHGPSVFQLLEDGYVLSEKEALKVMRDIFSAIEFIHDRNIAHMDIKPANVVFTSDPTDNNGEFPAVSLIDFGLSTPCDRAVIDTRGTPGYIAPELLMGTNFVSNDTADVFSAGVLFFEILTGFSPYTIHVDRFIKEVGDLPDLEMDTLPQLSHVSKQTKNLVASCLNFHPEERPSASAILEEISFRLWMLD